MFTSLFSVTDCDVAFIIKKKNLVALMYASKSEKVVKMGLLLIEYVLQCS